MYACYHTHTARCKHASGTDEEYVKAAIAEGVSVLGFSDHAPMPYKNGYESYYKMTLSELSGYCDSVLSLREKYADKIEIRLGLETEYYPSLWEESLREWRKYPIEYLILGQHFVGEEQDNPRDPAPAPSDDEGRLRRHVDLTIQAMNKCRVSYVAHPDLLNYTGGDLDLYRQEIGRLINEAKRLGLPLEYNLLGMSDRRSYPNAIFWSEVGRLGATAILGCDAHEPYRVAVPAELRRARKNLDRLHVCLVDRVTLINPFA